MGGGGGLGRAIALDYAWAGMRLLLCDKNEELLEDTMRELGNDTDAVSALVDVRDADALTQAFADGLERFGRLDVLVNVAGGTFKADFLDTNTRGGTRSIRANFGWLLHSTQLAARQMVDQGDGGSIITLTSIEGHRAAPGYAVYAGMKAAVTNFSRTLALELAPHGIRVNCIAPDTRRPKACPRHTTARGRGRHPDGSAGHLRGHRRVRAVPRLRPLELRHRHHPAPRRRRVRVGGLVQLAGSRLPEHPAGVRLRPRAMSATVASTPHSTRHLTVTRLVGCFISLSGVCGG